MTLLVDHPQEIVDSILQWVSPKDLCTLCLVNKSFYIVAQPRLFAKIEWEWDTKKAPPVAILLRSLLEKPALGDYVQVAILNGENTGTWRDVGRARATPQFDDSGVDALVAFVKSRALPRRYANNWIKGLRSSRINFKMDAYITCLLAMLPNIKHLRLEPAFAYHSHLSSRIFRVALSVFPRQNKPNLPLFEQLRVVAYLRRIFEHPSRKSRGVDSLTPLFYLPTVHQLSASIENTPYWKWPEHKPTLQTLTTLDLTDIQARHLGTILAETKNLNTLRWGWGGWPEASSSLDGMQWINLTEMMASLQHVQKTLVSLEITESRLIRDDRPPQMGLRGSLEGLAAFETLKSVKLPLVFLAGLVAPIPPDPPAPIYESLPATVTNVTLSGEFSRTGGWRGDSLLGVSSLWMENVKTATPRLQRLEWVMTKRMATEWHDNPQLESSILAACGRAGVNFGVAQFRSYWNHRRRLWEPRLERLKLRV
ncbi:hypothetical protein ACHAPT_012270 [Fusarium lateritium]